MLQEIEHKSFRENPYFGQYVDLLIRLHDAMRNANEDEAEQLREKMDEPGLHLTRDEIQWVKGLSSDLYMFDNDESFRPLDRTPLQLITDIKAATERSDGEALLQLLRRADFISPEHRAWFRSRAYDMLGYYGLSLRFLAFASDQAPERLEYNYMILAKMVQQRDFANARQAALHFIESPDQSPKMKIIIAIALCSSCEDLSSEESRPFLLRSAELINSLMAAEQQNTLPPDDALMAWMILADAYFKLGDIESALIADDKALNVIPNNPYALEERGRHRLSTDRQGALEDFVAATHVNSKSPFPYLFVIREYLLQRQYLPAKDLSETFISRTDISHGRAQAFEFLALAYYSLGYSAPEVDEVYRTAIELAPDNQRRRQNYDAIRASNLGIGGTPQFVLPTLVPEDTQVPPTSEISSIIGMYNQQSVNGFTERIFQEDYALAV